MDACTQQVVDYALQTKFQEMDSEVVYEAKRRLIDTLACAMGSYHHPLSVEMRDMASQYNGLYKSTIWGTAIQSTPEMAAFANGVMLRVGENSDTFIGSGGGGHPSDVFAAITAVAEYCKADGKALVEASVIAYDVYCTLMNIANFGAKGWDQVIHVALGAVLGAGRLMGLNRQQMGHAVGLALAPNMALRQTRHGELSSWKGCAGANAARNAVFAALLAHRGVEGPSEIFEGRQGVWNAVGRFEWPELKAWKASHMIARTSIKSLPVCYHIQSAALSALNLHQRLQCKQIASVHVETYQTAFEMAAGEPGQWSPKTPESADHSLPFVVGTALALGKVQSHCFEVAQLSNRAVLDVVEKVSVEVTTDMSVMWPQTAPAKVTVHTKDGAVFTEQVLYPLGHTANPMTDAQLNNKFREMLSLKAEGASDPDGVLQAIWNLETVTNITQQILLPLARCSALERIQA